MCQRSQNLLYLLYENRKSPSALLSRFVRRLIGTVRSAVSTAELQSVVALKPNVQQHQQPPGDHVKP